MDRGDGMDCLDAKKLLEPCAKGELGAANRAELERHIATCEGCRLELELTRAVLGSSSADSPGDSTLDPDMEEDDPVAFGAVSMEPSIEQERAPEIPSRGPEPPRVLTSQLPEDHEEELGLESLHTANAYDPGAIDLPHHEPQASFEESAPASPAAPVPDQKFSFEDLAAEAPPAASAKAVPAAATAESGAGGSWNFEPVDVPRAATPPEESLSFAKEALDRKRGKALREKQGARLLLWVGGAVGGVGLLGVSVWMALAFREPEMVPDPGNVPAVQPPPGTASDLTAPADSIVATPEGTPGLTATDSAATSNAAPSFIKASGGLALPGIAPPGVTVPKPATGSTKEPARAGAQPAPANAPETALKPAKPAATPAPVAFRDDELAPAPRREPQILKVEPDGAPGSDKAFQTESDPAPKEPVKSVSTAPIFVAPGSTTKSTTGTGTATKQPTEDPAAGTPIGRLHVATVAAEKNKALEELRKLKESWKTLIRTNTGADRARSKREYADCLWAIQVLTGRDADRKEALTAYREYVLHAPAGGTDARTVSRMRHLEDILSDTQ